MFIQTQNKWNFYAKASSGISVLYESFVLYSALLYIFFMLMTKKAPQFNQVKIMLGIITFNETQLLK